MAVESAADRAVFLAIDEFGITAVYTLAGGFDIDIIGIFDAPFLPIADVAEVRIAGDDPQFLCRTADLPPGAKAGDRLTVNNVAYVVREPQDSGTGMTLLALEKM